MEKERKVNKKFVEGFNVQKKVEINQRKCIYDNENNISQKLLPDSI